jgi:hypothetical protein
MTRTSSCHGQYFFSASVILPFRREKFVDTLTSKYEWSSTPQTKIQKSHFATKQ